MNAKNILFLCIILVGISVISCSQSVKLIQKTGPIMGTSYQLKISRYQLNNISERETDIIALKAYEKLVYVDAQMSHYKKDSDIGKFNNAPVHSKIPICKDTAKVISQALDIHKKTNGAFDITIGAFVNYWGFGPISKDNDKVNIQSNLAALGKNSFTLLQEGERFFLVKNNALVKLDLSAIAKGYSLDLAAKVFDENKVPNYFIDVGGEIRTKGVKDQTSGWKVVIELPKRQTREVAKIIHPKNISLATSGNYRNFYLTKNNTIHHTINPKTGHPSADTLGSITVAHQDCMMADAWATAINVLGKTLGLDIANKYGLDALFIFQNARNEFEYVFTGKFKELTGL